MNLDCSLDPSIPSLYLTSVVMELPESLSVLPLDQLGALLGDAKVALEVAVLQVIEEPVRYLHYGSLLLREDAFIPALNPLQGDDHPWLEHRVLKLLLKHLHWV